MTVRVVSLCWGSAWERYGPKFAQSFAQYWPADVELVMVTDRFVGLPRGKQVPLDKIPGYRAFLDKWADDPKATGKLPPAGTRKIDANGYSWRHDAAKWMPQALAPTAGIEGLADGDIFVWFDADTETTRSVPSGWVEGLIGDADVVCLQRPGTHSEIGFYALRVGPKTRSIVSLFADFYTREAVFRLNEWHSAYVFDRVLETVPCLKVKNLNPGLRGHIWPDIPALANHTMHHKGKRKDQ